MPSAQDPNIFLSLAVSSLELAVEPVLDTETLKNALSALEIIVFRIETKIQEAAQASQEQVKKEEEERRNDEEIKTAFKILDGNSSGTLQFEEFFALLKQGDPSFTEEQAMTLFNTVDHDLSAEIDFDEFIDHIFKGHTNKEKVIKAEPRNTREEEAKASVLSKNANLRTEAVAFAKAHGQVWKQISWQERLEVLHHVEEEQQSGGKKSLKRPATSPGTYGAVPAARQLHLPRSSIPDINCAAALSPSRQSPFNKSKGPAIKDMSQYEIVDYAFDEDDFEFVAANASHKQQLRAFISHLKTASTPSEVIEIRKFIAKGTAGWVFMAREKSSGLRVALKLVRMTQARTCLKEWFVSKLLRNVGVENVVYTEENVFVLPRIAAPQVIDRALENAGPVPYYVCLVQEFLSGGTLESLAEDGRLSPGMMFKALEDVALTLALMHANQVQHKDVKPENVLVEMTGGQLTAAKLCDFGSAQVGHNPSGEADDIRRFGVTLFSLATGESWTKNRLIREDHKSLVERLGEMTNWSNIPTIKRLPEVLRNILEGGRSMVEVAALMTELRSAFLK